MKDAHAAWEALEKARAIGAFWGAARAAEAAGNRQKAADYYAKLIALSKNADTTRPELARARGFVAQR